MTKEVLGKVIVRVVFYYKWGEIVSFGEIELWCENLSVKLTEKELELEKYNRDFICLKKHFGQKRHLRRDFTETN